MRSIFTLFFAGVLVLPAFSGSREFSADLNAGGQVDWVGVSQKQQVPTQRSIRDFFSAPIQEKRTISSSP